MADHYKIGQVLYIIPVENAKIIPVQVIERRISESISGTAVKHIIKSSSSKVKPVILESIKVMGVYSSIDDVRRLLVKNATDAIDEMAIHAQAVAHASFAQAETANKSNEVLDETAAFMNDFEDSQLIQQAQRYPPKRQQLTANSMIDDVNENDEAVVEIMGPDGKMRLVKANIKS